GKPPRFVRATAATHTGCSLPRNQSRRQSLSAQARRDRSRHMTLKLEALETSFDLVAPRGDELMDVFYARLFAAAPAVKPLFAGTDMTRQKSMLLAALVLLRKSFRDLDAVVPTLHKLGGPATWRTAPGRS